MIIINSPNNPSGTILSKEDMLTLEKTLKNTSILLLCDDVYEHIIFDGQKHQSSCLYPDLKKRAFICSSFGKTYHITGWKIGYCLAPKELMQEFRKAHQYTVFSVHHPSQIALANFINRSKDYLELHQFYQEKRDFFLNAIKGSKFKFTPTKGTYFQLVDYSSITDENDMDYAIRLVKEQKIAAIPLSPFNTISTSKVLRFCFAKKNETLEKAAEILCKIN
jgi:methionine aminotransferase